MKFTYKLAESSETKPLVEETQQVGTNEFELSAPLIISDPAVWLRRSRDSGENCLAFSLGTQIVISKQRIRLFLET
jgi:hypothetical protein